MWVNRKSTSLAVLTVSWSYLWQPVAQLAGKHGAVGVCVVIHCTTVMLMQFQQKWRHLFKKIYAILDQFPEDRKIHHDLRISELLWTASVHSKRYSRPNLHITTFPTRSITSWLTAELIDVCADWSSHSSFPQRHYNGYSGWKWLQPQKGPPPAPVQPLAWAVSLWYKWRQVIHLYVASIELSAQKYHRRCTELHITALQPRSAGSGFTSTPPPQPRRNGRWMEGWTVRICHRNRPDLRVSKSRYFELIGDDK